MPTTLRLVRIGGRSERFSTTTSYLLLPAETEPCSCRWKIKLMISTRRRSLRDHIVLGMVYRAIGSRKWFHRRIRFQDRDRRQTGPPFIASWNAFLSPLDIGQDHRMNHPAAM